MSRSIELCSHASWQRNSTSLDRRWWNEVRCELRREFAHLTTNRFFRGLVSINALRRIEDLLGEPIHTMFDYMSGVSTGAVITAMLGNNNEK